MQKIRNIAIIAHVDHGKTTLVDKMIFQGNLFRETENTGDLLLDNNDLERERGITILAKNVSVHYKDYKINIIDTPGHADFGGEVERVLNMADGVLLLVDAFEGTMPQTRFVLQKALALGKKPIVVVNKVDKPNCRPDFVYEQVFDLMFSLDATEEQLDFTVVYGSAKQGWMSTDWHKPTTDITPLLDAIIKDIPAPKIQEGTPQMLITSLEYSSYVGRIAIGKLTRGTLKSGMPVTLCKRDGVTLVKTRIKDLMTFEGMGKQKVDEVQCGEICALVGIEGFEIGDTIADFENPEALAPIAIDEPTMSMLFTINDSPFFGRDGKYVTSRHIKERLDREFDMNVITTVPNVMYIAHTTKGEVFEMHNPSDMPSPTVLDYIEEPYIKAQIITPTDYIGQIMTLCLGKRGVLIKQHYLTGNRIELNYEMPLAEIVFDFYDKLKSITKGYASFDYFQIGYRRANLVKLDILLNGESVDALSALIHFDNAYSFGKRICEKLKELIPRQQFDIAIQAAIGAKIISRETIKAVRKDVTAKCYGGDISRKRKLLEKQKKGKKRMKQIGNVEVPQKAFLAVLKLD